MPRLGDQIADRVETIGASKERDRRLPLANDRFELGINLKEAVEHPRVKSVPPGGMCPYVAALTSADEVDAKLIAIIKRAYDAAG